MDLQAPPGGAASGRAQKLKGLGLRLEDTLLGLATEPMPTEHSSPGTGHFGNSE